jgi:metal-sulfur cluster biosynthetic enzyme
VLEALATVMDPELDEPITELGFVRSVALHPAGVTVHLRLPTSFCSPNFAYLMVSDAQDALRRVRGIGQVTVLLDDHHDSDKINAGIAANAGYLGTFGAEAEEGLDALRLTFQRKAHTAAMERCVMAVLTAGAARVEDLGRLTLADLPAGRTKEALLRRRTDIGLEVAPGERVVVDEHGGEVPDEELPLRLRLATSVRISIEGNAHFCRGLLATRYAGGDTTALTTQITDTSTSHPRTANGPTLDSKD